MDVLLVQALAIDPVGRIAGALSARIVIPMHYAHGLSPPESPLGGIEKVAAGHPNVRRLEVGTDISPLAEPLS